MRPTRRREGELVALAFNQKEQRLLDRSIATIRLEASYSLKLLDLSNRNVKVYFRQLRDKVSRLKSHLTADEIQELQHQEAEGKLHPAHPSLNLGSALKIAATNRRLNPPHQRRPPTAQAAGPRSPAWQEAEGPPQTQRLRRSNSVTGVFVDVPVAPNVRPLSAHVLDNRASEQTSVRPQTSLDHQQQQSQKISPTLTELERTDQESRQQRPVNTDSVFHSPKMTSSHKGVDRRPSSSNARLPFSSHAATEKSQGEGENMSQRDAGGVGTPISRYGSFDKGSSFLGLLQDDAVDDLDQELYEERRAELLEEEQLRAASLTKRKDRFLKDLDQYLRDHPATSVRPRHYSLTRKTSSKTKKKTETATAEEEEDLTTEAMFRRRRVEFDLNPTCLPELDYRERLQRLWKDMNTCRYLRLSDDRLDLSGVNTLATDTLKLYKVLKQQDRKTSHGAKVTAKET